MQSCGLAQAEHLFPQVCRGHGWRTCPQTVQSRPAAAPAAPLCAPPRCPLTHHKNLVVLKCVSLTAGSSELEAERLAADPILWRAVANIGDAQVEKLVLSSFWPELSHTTSTPLQAPQ